MNSSANYAYGNPQDFKVMNPLLTDHGRELSPGNENPEFHGGDIHDPVGMSLGMSEQGSIDMSLGSFLQLLRQNQNQATLEAVVQAHGPEGIFRIVGVNVADLMPLDRFLQLLRQNENQAILQAVVQAYGQEGIFRDVGVNVVDMPTYLNSEAPTNLAPNGSSDHFNAYPGPDPGFYPNGGPVHADAYPGPGPGFYLNGAPDHFNAYPGPGPGIYPNGAPDHFNAYHGPGPGFYPPPPELENLMAADFSAFHAIGGGGYGENHNRGQPEEWNGHQMMSTGNGPVPAYSTAPPVSPQPGHLYIYGQGRIEYWGGIDLSPTRLVGVQFIVGDFLKPPHGHVGTFYNKKQGKPVYMGPTIPDHCKPSQELKKICNANAGVRVVPLDFDSKNKENHRWYEGSVRAVDTLGLDDQSWGDQLAVLRKHFKDKQSKLRLHYGRKPAVQKATRDRRQARREEKLSVRQTRRQATQDRQQAHRDEDVAGSGRQTRRQPRRQAQKGH